MKFNSEKRPDIAVSIAPKTLAGAARFIAPIVFPQFSVTEAGGTISFAKVNKGKGEKDRAAGTALQGSQITPVAVSYNTAMYEDRARLTDKDVCGYANDDAAILSGAMSAAYGVISKVEEDAAAAIFTSTRYSAAKAITTDDPFGGMMEAATTVKHYGTPTLVCSEFWLAKFVSIPEVRKVLVEIYGHQIVRDVINAVPEAIKACGAVFGVQQILIGDNAFWSVEGMTDAAAVVGIREELGNDPRTMAKTFPAFGVTPTLIPTGGDVAHPLEIETGYDPNTKDNLVDAQLGCAITVINAAGAVLVKLPAA